MQRGRRTCFALASWAAVIVLVPSPAMGQPDDEKEVRQLLKQLHDPDENKRWAAADTLADFDNLARHADVAIPELLQALKYTDNLGLGAHEFGGGDSLRDLVMLALKNAGPKGEKALVDSGIAMLIKDLDKEPLDVQYHTLCVLSHIGPNAEAAIPVVVKLASAKNKAVSHEALAALHEMGPKATAILLDMARKGDSDKKEKVLALLNWRVHCPELVVPAMIQFLDDVDAGVRSKAAQVLGKIGLTAKDAVPALLNRMDDEKMDEVSHLHLGRFVAAYALGRIGEAALPGLIKAIDDPNDVVKLKAIHALGIVGPNAKPAIKSIEKVLYANKLDISASAAIALLRLDAQPQEPIKVLSLLLKHPNADVRLQTLLQLELLKKPRPELLMAIGTLLQDPNPDVAMVATVVIRRYGKSAKSVLPKLIVVLDQPNQDLRLKVLITLQSFRPLAKDAIPAVIKCLKDDDKSIALSAATLLELMGTDAAAAVPALTEILKRDNFLSVHALRALAKIGGPAKTAIPAMFQAVRDHAQEQRQGHDNKYLTWRRYVLDAISDLGPAAKDAVPDLLQMLKEEKGPPADVIHALGSIGPNAKEALPLLEAALKNSKEPRIAAESHAALALITGDHAAHLEPMLKIFKKVRAGQQHHGDKRVILKLISRLEKSAPQVIPIALDWLKSKKIGLRGSALDICARLGPQAKSAVPQLAVIAKESTFSEQIAAVRALAAIGPDAAPAMPALEELTRDDDVRLRDAAAEALAKIKAK